LIGCNSAFLLFTKDYMSYQPLALRSFTSEETLTPAELEEKAQWGSFRDLSSTTKFGRVITTSYNPVCPHSCFVMWSNEMGAMLPLDTEEVVFHQTAPHGYGHARYRRDGEILVYSVGDRGNVHVITKAGDSIKSMQHHRHSVKVVGFTYDKIHVASWGLDCVVNVCSLGTGDIVFTAPQAHSDGCLAGDTHPTESNILCSGSSDNIVKIWDIREKGTSQAAMVLPVETAVHSLRFAPQGGDLLACGGVSTLYVFDRRSTKPVFRVTPHAKAIVDMCFTQDGSRLLTASLDRSFRVMDATNGYRTVFAPAPLPTALTAIAISPDGAEMSIGREDGVLTRRIAGGFRSADDEAADEIGKQPRPQHWARSTLNDVGALPRKREARYDYELRSFSYRNALITSLNEPKSGDNDVPFAVLEDLLQRNGLRVALAGWNEEEIFLLLKYLIPNMKHRQRTQLIIVVFEIVLEIYCEELVKSERLMTIVRALHADLEVHEANLEEMEIVSAALDIIMEPGTVSP